MYRYVEGTVLTAEGVYIRILAYIHTNVCASVKILLLPCTHSRGCVCMSKKYMCVHVGNIAPPFCVEGFVWLSPPTHLQSGGQESILGLWERLSRICMASHVRVEGSQPTEPMFSFCLNSWSCKVGCVCLDLVPISTLWLLPFVPCLFGAHFSILCVPRPPHVFMSSAVECTRMSLLFSCLVLVSLPSGGSRKEEPTSSRSVDCSRSASTLFTGASNLVCMCVCVYARACLSVHACIHECTCV